MIGNYPIVAPYMGAWIETPEPYLRHFDYVVAPYMGAWIETKMVNSGKAFIDSCSLYGSMD